MWRHLSGHRCKDEKTIFFSVTKEQTSSGQFLESISMETNNNVGHISTNTFKNFFFKNFVSFKNSFQLYRVNLRKVHKWNPKSQTPLQQLRKQRIVFGSKYLGQYSNEAVLLDKQQMFYFFLFSDKGTTLLQRQIHPKIYAWKSRITNQLSLFLIRIRVLNRWPTSPRD